MIHQWLSNKGDPNDMESGGENRKYLPEVAFAIDCHIQDRSRLSDIVDTLIGSEKGPRSILIGPHWQTRPFPNKRYTNTNHREGLHVNQPFNKC